MLNTKYFGLFEKNNKGLPGSHQNDTVRIQNRRQMGGIMYLGKSFHLSPLEVWRASGFYQWFEQGQLTHKGGQRSA